MRIEEMPVYSLTKEFEEYLNEMNDGVEDKKALELIMKLKMNEYVLEYDMYKVQAFTVLESLYGRVGDDLFEKDKYKDNLKILFKEIFTY